MVTFFSANIQDGCSPLAVNFFDNSSGSPTSWLWDFGNGQTSTQQNPSASYINPGLYNVTLIASNATSSDTLTRVQFVEVFQAPTANFVVGPSMGCTPLNVAFTNISIPGSTPIATTIWDFGDNTGSLLYNPNKVYNQPGRYDVSLLLIDSNGCQATQFIQDAVHVGTRPTAGFTADSLEFCVPPTTVNFTNNSSGNQPLSYTWRFGDGTTSNQVSPSHTYNSNGRFTVTLLVTDSMGCQDSLVRRRYISVVNLNADFTADTTVICAESPVQFTNLSNPPGTDWLWDFGDANNSTLQNPRHSYASAGLYTVSLTVQELPLGCTDNISRTNFIRVLPKPNAAFTLSNNEACKAPLTVNFQQTSTGALLYSWDFGDGSAGLGGNPSHTYTSAGAFRVRLFATNIQGCWDTAAIDSAVRILPPTPSFSASNRDGCVPLYTQFQDRTNSVNPIIRWFWDFGDGNTSTAQSPNHIYQNTGSYDVQLTVENNLGCIDSFTVPAFIVVGDTPQVNFGVISATPCVNQPDSFFDLSIPADRWLWSFGDSTTDTIQNPVHIYTDTGYFDVSLRVWDRGCPNDTVSTQLIRVLPPKAGFSFAINCTSPYTIAFTDLSEGAINYFWDFGDLSTSTQSNPIHTYADTGLFTVTQIVENPTYGCTDTFRRNVYIADIQAQFNANPTAGCKPLNVNFTNNSQQGVSFLWIYGDGNTDTTINASNIYVDTGFYNVTLIATDANGCSDTFTQNNLINAYGPIAEFSSPDLAGCIPYTSQFTDQSAAYLSPIVSWNWDFGNGTGSNLQNPSVTYNVQSRKTVRLIVTDANGCFDTMEKVNYVFPTNPVADFRADTNDCPGQNVQFTSISFGASLTYLWNFGDGGTSVLRNPAHSYLSDSSYDVKLVVTDINGCKDSITKLDYITITSPSAGFTTSNTTSTCPPFLVIFTDTSTGFPVSWQWDFGDGGTSRARNPFHVYQTAGNYDVRLIVTSQFGCVDTIIKENLIRIDGPSGSFTFDTTFGCQGQQVNFTAQLKNTRTIIWGFGDGKTIVGQSQRSHIYEDPGTFWPTLTIQDSLGCVVFIQSDDSILIDVIPSTELPNDTVVCQGNDVFLDSKVLQASSFQWNPTADLVCPTCPATLSTTRVSRTYSFTASSLYGCTASDTINIDIDTIILPEVLSDFVICPGEEVILNENGEILSFDLWNPKNFWSPELYMDDSTLITPTVNPLDTITYRLTAFPKKNCLTGSGNFASVSRNVVTFNPIDKVEATTIPDTYVCPDDSVLLSSQVIAASYLGYTVRWYPIYAVDRPQKLSPYAIPPGTTDYRLIVSSGTCEPDTARVNIEMKTRPFVDAGPDQTTIAGAPIDLNANGANDLSYQWTPSDSMFCDTCYSTTLTPFTSGMYYVRVVDEFGCRNVDSMYVYVSSSCGEDGMFVPSAFSPNGDGSNDVFRIRSLGIQEIDYFRVFNRWGDLVFETNDINTGWDGSRGTEFYNAGVYVFAIRAICPDGTLSDLTGNVTLIR